MPHRMIESPWPLHEYDPEPGIIESGRLNADDRLPERMVATFFGEVAEWAAGQPETELLLTTMWEDGPVRFYRTKVEDRETGFFHCPVGGPKAGSVLDFAIEHGVREIIACGGCGVLDRDLAVGHILVPHAAIRDEGMSYHYLPPSREVSVDPLLMDRIVGVLERRHVPHLVTKTWTTDAPYRETRAKMERRRAEGCLAVEMECASLAAVAQFKQARFAQLLYSGDNLGGDTYDDRRWQSRTEVRRALFTLALHASVAD